LPKRDSQLALMLEDTADRTRRFLPMHTTGRRVPVPILFGSMAIGRKIVAAISGWLDTGRDDRINTMRLAAIGIVMAIVASGIVAETGIATAIVDIDLATAMVAIGSDGSLELPLV
jgi:hypothetical protein